MRNRNHANVFIAVLLVAVLMAVVWNWPFGRRNIVSARSALYALARERGRADYAQSISGWHERSSAHFIVRYQTVDADVADMVLQSAESHYAQVTKDVGFTPEAKSLIALYPTREALRDSFGWPANQNAVGVYWGGAIRLLSPHAWVSTDNLAEIARVFRDSGPLVHEFTHLVLDYRTNGNYPRWFTEGLAQWEEYRITGYVWNDPDGDMDGRAATDLYKMNDLESNFDSLDNQALAYRESLSFITCLADGDGGVRLNEVLAQLARHYPLNLALSSVYGQSVEQLQQNWLSWAAQNPYPWK